MAGRPALGQEYAALKRAEPGSRQELAYQVWTLLSVKAYAGSNHCLDIDLKLLALL